MKLYKMYERSVILLHNYSYMYSIITIYSLETTLIQYSENLFIMSSFHQQAVKNVCRICSFKLLTH